MNHQRSIDQVQFPYPYWGSSQPTYTQTLCPTTMHSPSLPFHHTSTYTTSPKIVHSARSHTARLCRKNSQQGLRDRKRTPDYWEQLVQSPHLNDEDKLLVRLRGIEKLPWKLIQENFNRERETEMKQPALQMRMRRLIEKMDKLGYSEKATKTHEPFNQVRSLQSSPGTWSASPSPTPEETTPRPERWAERGSLISSGLRSNSFNKSAPAFGEDVASRPSFEQWPSLLALRHPQAYLDRILSP
ncbi:hypothetical protein K3495_g4316 [Podosphaera aphanis]|nr:hypothetical protein K3495_g4316 [Podosphaera aphanis]